MKKFLLFLLLILSYLILAGFSSHNLFRDPRIIGNPREVVFVLHGMGGSASDFNGFRARIVTYEANNAHFLDIIVRPSTSYNQTLESIVRRGNLNDRLLFILVEFSNSRDYVENQVRELIEIRNNISDILGWNTQYSIVGHSKGGLVATSFAARVGGRNGRLNRVITLGTPFTLHWWHYWATNFGLDRTIGDPEQMRAIRNQWNNIPIASKPRAYAFATETNFLIGGHNSDGMVPSGVANGSGFNAFIPTVIRRPSISYGNTYRHANMVNTDTARNFIMNRLGFWRPFL